MNNADSNIQIGPARPEDATHIATAIMMAVGYDICNENSDENFSPSDLHRLFTELAGRTDSQYSYLNTLVARAADGTVAGVCIAYDGAELPRLSRAFFAKARELWGRDLSTNNPETTPDEFYLDTLAVWPQYRKQGIGARLLMAQAERGRNLTGKHVGLLVDKDNPSAEKLYRALGFRSAGERPFLGTMMNHLVLD